MERREAKEEDFPAVNLAYELSLKSLDQVAKRLEMMDDRVDKMVIWVTSINLAIIGFIGKTVELNRTSLKISLGAFILGTLVGLFGKYRGGVKIISPSTLERNWLTRSALQFKRDAIAMAVKDYNTMCGTLDLRWYCHTIASFFYLLDAIGLLMWIKCLHIAQ